MTMHTIPPNVYPDRHTRAQCSHASVGLAQALPNYLLTCWQRNTNSICDSHQTLSRFSCESLASRDYIHTTSANAVTSR